MAWIPFVRNDTNMLWLALVGRNAGVRCSDLIGIESEAVAFDLDFACSLRLMQYENKREFARMKAFKSAIKEAIGELFGADPPADDADDSEPEINENDVL